MRPAEGEEWGNKGQLHISHNADLLWEINHSLADLRRFAPEELHLWRFVEEPPTFTTAKCRKPQEAVAAA